MGRAPGCAGRSRPDRGRGTSAPRRATMSGMAGDRLRILLVDDHEVVRDGVKSLIDANDDLSVVAEAGTVKEAVAQAERTRPDVVVMDVRLADGSGIEATREIRARLEKAQVLKLAEKTVKNYVSTILSKLEVARRAEAAAYLARHTSTPGSTG